MRKILYLKKCLYVFVVVSLATVLLNYTVMRNLDVGSGKTPFLLSARVTTPIMAEVSSMLLYRRNHSTDEPLLDTAENYLSALSDGDVLGPFPNNSFFNCALSEEPLSVLRRPHTVERNSYTKLINYVVATKSFSCNESITYTTHGEFRYLDNLVPLVERWEGPISMALYAPGSDLSESVKRIHFLRECTSPMIKELVTFHIFYDRKFADLTVVPDFSVLENRTIDCSSIPSFGDETPSFRRDHRLAYPVNVARNLARKQATTHFLLMSDVELYPSLNIIPHFLSMIVRNEVTARAKLSAAKSTNDPSLTNPRVYVLPIFEVEEAYPIPDTKNDLKKLLIAEKAVPFHKYVCPECHKVPNYASWIRAKYNPNELNVFHVSKRRKPYHIWEPIYIGTNQEPFYDERLTWEGLRDKMSQGYALCLLNYEFMILDNAFLVHRPGIKKKKRSKKPTAAVRKQNRMLEKIQIEIEKKYGKRPGCFI